VIARWFDAGRSQYAPNGLDDIQSFVSHLQAQSGKKVTAAIATQLESDAANVYLHVLCRALAAGQLTSAMTSSRYAYYVALMTSLRETPKPMC